METTNLKSAFSGANYTTILKTDTHQIIGDEPEEDGGQNKGFNPYELLLAALATCTTATIKMYADRKLWQINSITIDMKMYAVEKQQVFVREILIDGLISEDQRKRLLTIAEKCPVHKILSVGNQIQTTLILKNN